MIESFFEFYEIEHFSKLKTCGGIRWELGYFCETPIGRSPFTSGVDNAIATAQFSAQSQTEPILRVRSIGIKNVKR